MNTRTTTQNTTAFRCPPPYISKGFGYFRLSFTLAETLITLTIIGIIAALTVPNLMKNYQRGVYEASFKRGYNLMKNGVAAAINENGIDFFDFTYNPSGSAVDVTSANLENIDKFSEYLSGNAKKTVSGWRGTLYYKLYNGQNTNDGGGCARTETTLRNGMTLITRGSCWMAGGRSYFILDINGKNKKPNRWGYDWWAYEIDATKKILHPAGMSGAHYGHDVPYKCGTKGSSKLSEDYGCSYWALINKCPDDETKTYWECLKL